jgi:nucleotide-binding universal stress UspA family protein
MPNMKPFNKMFVAIDDSSVSKLAVDYAAGLARREDATVTFCHSVDLASDADHQSFAAPNKVARLAALRRNGRALLAAAQATAEARSVPANVLELLGSTATASVNAAMRRGASAIVVGTESANRSATSIGALAEEVLRLSDRPVILVSRPFAPAQAPASIVVGIDGSEPAKAALNFALDLAADGRARIVATHVLGKNVSDKEVSERRAMLGDVVAFAARRGVAIDAAFARGLVVDELADAVRMLKADLLVVGSHGPGTLRALPMPSIAKRATRAIPVPVAVVRCPGAVRPAELPRTQFATAS